MGVLPYDATRTAVYAPETRDTLFENGVPYSPLQLAIEAARLAYYRAEESTAQMQRLSTALARAGFPAPVLFVDEATGAVGFGTVRAVDGTALLALRGTQPDNISDIAHDLKAYMVPWPESAGRVHAGFAGAIRSILPQIRQWLARTGLQASRMIITGHSLGAAMATLLASVLTPEWLVTMGSPRVGDEDFVRTVKPANSVRLVDCCDVVTEVPPPIGGYTHLPTCTYLTSEAVVVANPPQSLIEADRSTARQRYLTELSWKIGNVLLRDLADHAPINYARAFFV